MAPTVQHPFSAAVGRNLRTSDALDASSAAAMRALSAALALRLVAPAAAMLVQHAPGLRARPSAAMLVQHASGLRMAGRGAGGGSPKPIAMRGGGEGVERGSGAAAEVRLDVGGMKVPPACRLSPALCVRGFCVWQSSSCASEHATRAHMRARVKHRLGKSHRA